MFTQFYAHTPTNIHTHIPPSLHNHPLKNPIPLQPLHHPHHTTHPPPHRRRLQAMAAAEERRRAQQIIVPAHVTVNQLATLLGVELHTLEQVLQDIGDPQRSPEEVVAPDSAELAALELDRVVIVEQAPVLGAPRGGVVWGGRSMGRGGGVGGLGMCEGVLVGCMGMWRVGLLVNVSTRVTSCVDVHVLHTLPCTTATPPPPPPHTHYHPPMHPLHTHTTHTTHTTHRHRCKTPPPRHHHHGSCGSRKDHPAGCPEEDAGCCWGGWGDHTGRGVGWVWGGLS